MKKSKRMVSMLMAFMITAGTMSTVSAGAMDVVQNFDTIGNSLDGFIEISKSETELFGKSYMSEYPDAVYFISQNYAYLIGDIKSSNLDIWISADTDIEDVKEIIAEISPHAIVSKGNRSDEKWTEIDVSGFDGTLSYSEAKDIYITLDKSKKIYKKLSEITQIKKCNYWGRSIVIVPIPGYLTEYADYSDSKKIVDNYITENYPDWHIESGYDHYRPSLFSVVPDVEVSILEHYKLANEIYKLTDMSPSLSSNDYEMDYGSGDVSVDLHNNVKGDANDDGELNLADAVMIMQSVCNPKYATFTHQGKYNADVTGDYDGITNKDALTIQRQLLGLE